MSDEQPLDQAETWIMRLGWLVIVAAIVLGLVQQYGKR